jgi:hypothetical protein
MTKEEFEHKHIGIINHLIDLTHEAADVWKFHPENPNRIDVIQYHAVLVAKISELEKQEQDFVAQYEQI